MSGADDRSHERPGHTPSFDEADIPLPARPRRKAKPPPNIITAGGVDMARGHATGILPRNGASAGPSLDEPRVVLAVETDPRRVPTHRRLVEAREGEDGARPALLPGSSHPTPVSTAKARIPESGRRVDRSPETPRNPSVAPAPAPAPAPAEEKVLPAWMRLAFAAVLLLSLVGVAQRFRGTSSPVGVPIAGDSLYTPLRPVTGEPVSVPPPMTELHAEPPPVSLPPSATAEPPAPPPPAAPSAGPTHAPATTGEPARAPRTHSPAPVARPSFAPPFQLPSEKN